MYNVITTILLGAVAIGGFFFPQYNTNELTTGARTDSVWNNRTSYIETVYSTGINLLINGSNKYLNFNTTSGSSGYGIRDNAGTIECKNSGGAWGACADGTGTTIYQLGQIGDVSTSTPMTYGLVLRYNTASSKWESVATSTLGISAGAETDPLSLHLTDWYATTTKANLVITKSQVSDFGTYLSSVTADSPLSGSGTSGSHLVFTNPGYITAITGGTCSNQFVRSINTAGLPSCATVGASDVSLANLTATDTTLTFSGTYTGATARTIGLNVGNSNTWTGLQVFGNASTTQLTVTGNTYFPSGVWKSTGNVGIGTTSPLAKLSIKGTGATTGRLLQITDSNNVEKVTILDSGNVGIGTTNPLQKLSLEDIDANNPSMSIKGTSAVMRASLGDVGSSNDGVLQLYNSAGTEGVRLRGSGTDNSFLAVSGGNVGIGTTNPLFKLHVVGLTSVYGALDSATGYDAGLLLANGGSNKWQINNEGTATTNDLRFYSYSGTAGPRMTIQAAGNVGIGTTAPGSQLEIGGTNPEIRFGPLGTADGMQMFYYTSLKQGRIQVFEQGVGAHNLALQPDGGNVGIGTTNPQATLDIINNDISLWLRHTNLTQGLKFDYNSISANGTNADQNVNINSKGAGFVLLNPTAGNVGIGTTAPVSTFHAKLAASSRAIIEANQNTPVSALYLWNNDATVTTGTGMLFGIGGNGTSTGFIGGVLSQGVDATNSRTVLRVLSNGTLSAVDTTGVMYLEGTATGAKIIMNGNVGIGTTSPAFKLDVYGTARLGATQLDSTLTIPALATPAGSFLAVNGSGQVIATSTPSGGGTLPSGTAGQTLSYVGTTLTATSSLTISAIGRVGIATSSPSSLLTVQSVAGQITNILTVASSTGATLFSIDSDGHFLNSPTSVSTNAFTINNASGNQIFNIDNTIPTMNSKLFQVGTTTPANNYFFGVMGNGHWSASSTTPVVSSCGTSPSINGSDTAFTVTVGSVSATTCTVTFAYPFSNVPVCTVSSQTATIAVGYTKTASAIILTNAALTSDVIDVHCLGSRE